MPNHRPQSLHWCAQSKRSVRRTPLPLCPGRPVPRESTARTGPSPCPWFRKSNVGNGLCDHLQRSPRGLLLHAKDVVVAEIMVKAVRMQRSRGVMDGLRPIGDRFCLFLVAVMFAQERAKRIGIKDDVLVREPGRRRLLCQDTPPSKLTGK